MARHADSVKSILAKAEARRKLSEVIKENKKLWFSGYPQGGLKLGGWKTHIEKCHAKALICQIYANQPLKATRLGAKDGRRSHRAAETGSRNQACPNGHRTIKLS
jgi:hypothetical protein